MIIFPGVKRPKCEPSQLPTSSTKFRNEWRYVSILLFAFMACTEKVNVCKYPAECRQTLSNTCASILNHINLGHSFLLIYLRSVLILSSTLRVVLPGDLIASGFFHQICFMYFSPVRDSVNRSCIRMCMCLRTWWSICKCSWVVSALCVFLYFRHCVPFYCSVKDHLLVQVCFTSYFLKSPCHISGQKCDKYDRFWIPCANFSNLKNQRFSMIAFSRIFPFM